MIAPPLFKCEIVTLEKAKGMQKLESALTIIEAVMKEKKGKFKVVNKPQILGHDDDKELDDIKERMKGQDDVSDDDEDNEEGIDIDLEEEEEGEEEKKEESKVSKKKKKKGGDSDDDDEDSN